MPEPANDLDARAILDGLFAKPPRSEADLRARLAPLDPADARRRLLGRLHDIGAPPRDSTTMVGALGALGLGVADLPAVSALLQDDRAALSGRAVALALVSALDPGRAQEIAGRLSPDDLMALNDAQLTAVIASMPTTPARVAEITRKLAQKAPDARTLRLGQIERIRRRLGIPAALLYRDALGRGELGLAAPLTDLVVEEGGAGAEILFEQLEEAQALARVYQIRGRSHAEIPRAEAWIGEASQDGAAALLLSLESAVDGSLTLVRVELDGERGALREGAAASLLSAGEVAAIVGELGSAAKATLAEVSARVEASARKTRGARGGAEFPIEAFAAICFFSLVGRI